MPVWLLSRGEIDTRQAAPRRQLPKGSRAAAWALPVLPMPGSLHGPMAKAARGRFLWSGGASAAMAAVGAQLRPAPRTRQHAHAHAGAAGGPPSSAAAVTGLKLVDVVDYNGGSSVIKLARVKPKMHLSLCPIKQVHSDRSATTGPLWPSQVQYRFFFSFSLHSHRVFFFVVFFFFGFLFLSLQYQY